MSEWQPIETAPKDGTDFLAYSDACNVYGVAYWNTFHHAGYLVCNDSARDFFNPTHWMPLPPPPANALLSRKAADTAGKDETT